MTVGFPPAKVTRAPVDGGCKPSRPSNTPAFCNDSLYRIMAATALASGMVPGAAFSYPFGIISIINRIVMPSCSEYPLCGRFAYLNCTARVLFFPCFHTLVVQGDHNRQGRLLERDVWFATYMSLASLCICLTGRTSMLP